MINLCVCTYSAAKVLYISNGYIDVMSSAIPFCIFWHVLAKFSHSKKLNFHILRTK